MVSMCERMTDNPMVVNLHIKKRNKTDKTKNLNKKDKTIDVM